MFSICIQTQIDIQASPDAVWRVLADLPRHDEWNPMLRNLHGDLEVGAIVRFEVRPDAGAAVKLKARITELRSPRHLVWRGGSAAAVAGEHYFRIESLESGGIRFHNGERFTGLLLPVLAGRLRASRPLYESMNLALKSRVEDAQAGWCTDADRRRFHAAATAP